MKLFFSRLKTRFNYLLYNGFLFRFGFGNRVSKKIWEQQYDNGTWDYLFSEEEASRFGEERLERTLDQIRQKYGLGSVHFGSLLHNDIGLDLEEIKEED